MIIGIQGVKASFHDVAARRFFDDQITPLECSTFRELCENLKAGQCEKALMAIENSIAGSILPNYSLLELFNFKILGEVYLKVEMALMALPNQKIKDLISVQSHPMALLQCEEFLAGYPHLKVVEGTDTAESAKIISEKQLLGQSAIANRLAAKAYGLEVLADSIESKKLSYTRFLVISTDVRHVPLGRASKTSLRFETGHAPGSLVQALQTFVEHGMNMTKIQSVPIQGEPYEYSFHVDLEWDDANQKNQALEVLKTRAHNVIHFGDYARGERPIV